MDCEYSKRKVSYFYNPNFGKFVYAKEHPMKPQRIAMAHSLVVNTGLYRHLNVYYARQASKEEMGKFHTEEYLNYLEQYVSKDITNKFVGVGIDRFAYPTQTLSAVEVLEGRQRFKVGESTDCPAFNGLYNLCQISSGASIDAACLLLNGQTDIAINYTGGLHHAKRSQASGFCYVNDIVLGALQLLQVFPRVMYLDIDVHHGDGVEEAFFLSNRCMSVSFHQYGQDFFPGTGGVNQVGHGDGKNYSLNIPLKPGITDDNFFEIYKDVLSSVMARYRPHALLIQLGADSLCWDKLGGFNMSIRGHSRCLEYALAFNLPTIMLGGGGYTIQNVARCWAYEAGQALGIQIDDNIPKNDPFYSKYGYDGKVHFPVKTVPDRNTPSQMSQLRATVLENIKKIDISPGVQFHNLPSVVTPWSSIPQTMDQQDQPFLI